LLFVFITAFVQAQTKYELKSTVDGVEFYYKWSRSNFFKKSSPPQLRVKIKNSNSYPVQYTFGLDLFVNGKTKGEVLPETFSIGANRTKAGKTNGHYYEFEVTWEDIKSPAFEIEFIDIALKPLDILE
jgi:hypothetical protein